MQTLTIAVNVLIILADIALIVAVWRRWKE